MLPPSGVSTPSAGSATTLPVDIRRFPWMRRLAVDYTHQYGRLSEFYAGDPGDPASWRDMIARTRAHSRPRGAIADIVQAQQRARGAPAEALAAAAQLRDAQTVAVLTGQQAGLFGGPLFTLLKALTALRLAERLRTEHRVPAVAVFWIDAEDHDWDEVRQCGVLDEELAPRSVRLETSPAMQGTAVAHVTLDESITTALDELESLLAPTDFSSDLLNGLRRAYQPGAGMADAFGRWLDALLGPRGLVVYDAADPAAKPLAVELFAREIERGGQASRLAADAARVLEAAGYHAQVAAQPENLALFHLDGTRQPIRNAAGDRLLVGGTREVTRADLIAELRRDPAAFSPNVLLRPLVQDTLFPTVCYVSGPSELAYLGQLKAVYAAFDLPMPLIQPRGSVTVLDANAMRFLARHELPLEALRARDESALNALLSAQLPPEVGTALDEAGQALDSRMNEVAQAVARIDPTLEGAARSTLVRMQEDLRKLQGKMLQAAKRKDETLRRQFQHAQAQAFPGGEPQEREVGFVYFLNRYGPQLVDRLGDLLPGDPGLHYVVTV